MDVFTDLVMFVCTYEAKVTKLTQRHEDLIKILEPDAEIKTLNCNFGHKAQKHYERFIKTGTKPRKKLRKGEGDKSCFNSALEPIIIPSLTDNTFKNAIIRKIWALRDPKYYFLKYFPTTGEIQIPGVILPSFDDGKLITDIWLDFINKQLSTTPIKLISTNPIMINYKFKVLLKPECIINLKVIIDLLESIPCEFLIREITPNQDYLKVSAKFVTDINMIRVKIFPRGKINLLGAKSYSSARIIYDYLQNIFQNYWDLIIVSPPEPDFTEKELWVFDQLITSHERLSKSLKISMPPPINSPRLAFLNEQI